MILAANATSAYSVLVWEKGGPGFGGMDNLGGDSGGRTDDARPRPPPSNPITASETGSRQ